MIRDRGNIKWTAMMLPEHVRMLKDWQEKNEKVEKPQLDNYELELISYEITRAYKMKSTIKLSYWREGIVKDDYGIISTIDNATKSLVLDDSFKTNRYTFDEIVAVSLIEGG